MAEGTGQAADAVVAAQSQLARRDAALAEADRQLADVVSDVHRVATEAVRRIEALRDEIDAAVGAYTPDSALGGAEMARFLLAKQREITEVVTAAADAARVKSLALQQLRAAYGPAQG